MEKIALVALGGAAGSVGRYLAGMGVLRLVGPKAPWAGTLTVNIIGGCLMGLLVGALALRGAAEAERWRLLLAVGALGGFTTFSAFSLDAALMIERRAWGAAAGYMAASVLLSIGALFAGLLLARRALG